MLAIPAGMNFMDLAYDMVGGLSHESKQVREVSAQNQEIRNVLHSIIGYQRSKMEDFIDKNVVNALKR